MESSVSVPSRRHLANVPEELGLLAARCKLAVQLQLHEHERCLHDSMLHPSVIFALICAHKLYGAVTPQAPGSLSPIKRFSFMKLLKTPTVPVELRKHWCS